MVENAAGHLAGPSLLLELEFVGRRESSRKLEMVPVLAVTGEVSGNGSTSITSCNAPDRNGTA